MPVGFLLLSADQQWQWEAFALHWTWRDAAEGDFIVKWAGVAASKCTLPNTFAKSRLFVAFLVPYFDRCI